MFDVGFTELVVCFVVALVVLGPERLPELARTMGRWTGVARGYLKNLTAELDRESQIAELRKQLSDARRVVESEGQSLRESASKLASDVTPKP